MVYSVLYYKLTNFDVEDLVIDLFYYFDKSTKRKIELLDFVPSATVDTGRF